MLRSIQQRNLPKRLLEQNYIDIRGNTKIADINLAPLLGFAKQFIYMSTLYPSSEVSMSHSLRCISVNLT